MPYSKRELKKCPRDQAGNGSDSSAVWCLSSRKSSIQTAGGVGAGVSTLTHLTSSGRLGIISELLQLNMCRQLHLIA